MKLESPHMLRKWLTINLESFDADPIALGTYILALVKKNKQMDLKTVLLEQLKVFLQNETNKFVELMLQTLQSKSYIKEPTVSDDVATKLSTNTSTRCKDYDEKGFCMRGKLCGFDHGTDAIVVDCTPDEFMTSLVIPFERDKYKSTKSLWPPLPTEPLPPLPPSPMKILDPLPTGELRGKMADSEDKFLDNSQKEEDKTCLKQLLDFEQRQINPRIDLSSRSPCTRNKDVKKVFPPRTIGATKKRTCEHKAVEAPMCSVEESQQHRIATQKIKLYQAKTQFVTKLVVQQKLVLEKIMKTTKKTNKVLLKKTRALGLHASRSAFRQNTNSSLASRSIDHRTKTILVDGIDESTDKEGLKKHFKYFGEIEKLEETCDGTIISFYNRVDAEAAFFNGRLFEDNTFMKILNLSWFNDRQLHASSHTPDSNEKLEQKTIEMISVEVEDVEEDNQEKSRFWRY